MKSSRKCKVTAAFLAAAALGGVAYAAPILNMNDLVGSSTTTESGVPSGAVKFCHFPKTCVNPLQV